MSSILPHYMAVEKKIKEENCLHKDSIFKKTSHVLPIFFDVVQ